MSAAVVPSRVDIAVRAEVEDFLYYEHDLLDNWELDIWLSLFTADGHYAIVTPGLANPDTVSSDDNLFLVSDDMERLAMRVERLKKTSTHVEFPRSATCHLISNVRVFPDGDEVRVRTRYVTYRTKSDETVHYLGHQIYRLVRTEGSFAIAEKRCVLALDSLSGPSKLSILL